MLWHEVPRPDYARDGYDGSPLYQYLLATRIPFGLWCRGRSDPLQRDPVFQRRQRLVDLLTPFERNKLALGGVPLAQALAYTLDGRGKLIRWGHKTGYSVMWRGESGVWWTWADRVSTFERALGLFHSEAFAEYRAAKGSR